MTYSHPSPIPTAPALPRRTKSEGHLHLRLRCSKGRRSPSSSAATMEDVVDKPRRPSTAPANADRAALCREPPSPARRRRASALATEASEQWDALFAREENSAYAANADPRGVRSSRAVEHRPKICTWCYNAADSLGIDRRVVSVAISYYDRYTSSPHFSEGNFGRHRDYWLLVVSCMCLAVKLHANRNESCHRNDDSYLDSVLYSLRFSCKMSRRSVAATEMKICAALGWYLNPPVPVNFLEAAMPLIDEIACDARLSTKASNEIVNVSQYLMEVCAFDARICSERPSSVAHAAILVAMNHLDVPLRTANAWLSLNIKHQSKVTDRCIPLLQRYLAANMAACERIRCASPTNVGGNAV